MTVEHEAFIDIETALHEKVDKLWRKHWDGLQKQINTNVNSGNWDEAYRLANEIDFTPIVEKSQRLARTFAEAALFLGASRLDEPDRASFYGNPDQYLIDRGVEQWAIVLTRNATEALRTQTMNLLAQLEMQREENEMLVIKADPLGKVTTAGTQYSRATASLMISRMSTAGFMLEASHRGIKTYRVNEVMDAATCPVCATMHNKTFPVADGVAQSSAIMSANDPESLKAVAPFPSQSKANVKAISNMGQSQLVGQGMHLPPYHPNCRGIVTLEQAGAGQSPAILSGLAAGERMLDTGDLTPDQLAARMFGDFDDLDDAYLGAALGVGAGAAFGVDDD